jgi:acyl-CoA synthetase (AMP-forming)/AMP-acid ligase II
MYLDELKRSLQVFGPVLAHLYGQGESPMTITGLRRTDHINADETVLGSVGWPRSGIEVAIFDADDRPLPAGEVGEIVCRGDVVMRGYWKNSVATEVTLRGGWLHTGDVGSLAPNGILTLRDRSKDLIISGGSNIYPREVEEVLLTHPDVVEAAVVGRSDLEWGEIVVAFIVANPARQPTEAELDAHCRARIARFKRPKIYVFRQELPKSSYGKVLKRELTGRAALQKAE